MISLILALLLPLCLLYVFYFYYLKPRAEIKRYTKIFRALGYKVYEQEFSFLNISIINYCEKGLRDHRDVLYIKRTVYPEVDISIGNYFG